MLRLAFSCFAVLFLTSSARAAEGPPKPPLVTIEMAAQLLHRDWSYTGTLTPNGLRTYTIPLMVEPRAVIGVYPLRYADGLVAAAGLEASGAVAISPLLAGSDLDGIPGGPAPETGPAREVQLLEAAGLSAAEAREAASPAALEPWFRER